MSGSPIDSSFSEALSALDILMNEDLARCSNVQEAREAVRHASLEDKLQTLRTHLESRAKCLSGFIEKAMPQYVRLMASDPSATDVIERAEEQMRRLLEPDLGHQLKPKTEG